jgi:hypothetical protein
MANLNLRNPNGYDGSPGTQYKQGIVRLATDAEVSAGTATNVAVTPAQLNSVSTGANFASPPVLGFGSTTPRPVHATTLSSLGTTTLNTSGAATTTIGTGGTGAVNIGNATGNTAITGSLTTTTTLVGGTGITATTGNIVASTGNITSTLGSVSAATTVTAGTSITATLGNITATNGNIVRGTAGNKDVYTSVASTTTAGANSAGTVVLVGGTATIATTAVTAASQIRLYRQGIGATGAAALGIVTRGTILAGVSFVINAVQAADATALQASDVSVIGWEIVN